MSDEQQFVIVGASLAGAKAAETLREEGFTGSIVLIGDEPLLPYERPPLSKGVLQGKEEASVTELHDQAWYDDQRVTLRLGSAATELDTGARTIGLADGSTVPYDRLLIATGSRVRTLDIPGAGLAGVHYLRTVPDSTTLTEAFRSRPRVVVVGAGWIGLEAAAAAREHGAEVTVVEPQSTALAAVLGEQVGEIYADLHRGHGVTFHFGTGVEEFAGDDRVTGVRISSGETIPADVVVVGVGVLPNIELASSAGIDVAEPSEGGGIVADASLRTSVPDVYAAGDLVRWDHPVLGQPVRVEHWANAHDGGVAVAKSMLSQPGQDPAVYDAIPFFYSDQYDAGMEYAGYVPRGTSYDVVLRGDPSSGEYMAFYLDQDDRLLAGMHVNTWDTIDSVQDLIRSKVPLDRAKLADPQVALTDVQA
ncbi:MAG TPA: FAD-dependent oxidoreductase [Kribbellaceae bacterium]|nr:FAD-dependent oxidoreductase [Kribbellaceae bacterium]